MKIFSKKRILLSAMILCVFLTFSSDVFAVDPEYDNETNTNPGATVLPSTEYYIDDCEFIMRYVDSHLQETTYVNEGIQPGTPGAAIQVPSIKEDVAKKELNIDIGYGSNGYINASYTDVLACAIKTGAISMWMVPFYIRYILEFIIGLAGLIAVGGVVYGGYLYLFAGLSDDKDKGKNAIKNGIIGLVLVMTAWAIVNIVISLVTL